MRVGRIIFLSLLVSVIGAAATFFMLRSYVGGGAAALVDVPAVSGMGLDQARQLLEAKSLRLVVFERRPDATQPPGKIAKQAPLAGSSVSSESPVYLIVSSGPVSGGTSAPRAAPAARAVVPGRAGPAARASANPAAGTPTDGRPPAASPPRGAQTPAAVMPAKASTAAAKTESVAVPRLVGRKVASARALLNKAGLRLGRRRVKVDEDRAPGLVLRQAPRAGAKVAPGTAIDVWINGD